MFAVFYQKIMFLDVAMIRFKWTQPPVHVFFVAPPDFLWGTWAVRLTDYLGIAMKSCIFSVLVR